MVFNVTKPQEDACKAKPQGDLISYLLERLTPKKVRTSSAEDLLTALCLQLVILYLHLKIEDIISHVVFLAQ